MMRRNCGSLLLWAAAALLGSLGCEQRPSGKTENAATTSPAGSQPTTGELAAVRQVVQAQPSPAGGKLPTGHPAIEATPPGATTGPHLTPAELKYTAPDEWTREPVTGNMRVDQYRLPHAADDSTDGELAVFYFGAGGAGGVEANVARWRGQFATADGGPIPDAAFSRTTSEINGLKVTVVELAGQYRPEMSMGAAPKGNYGMLGAIVETPAGPWFFKAIGPVATIAKHRDALLELLKTLRLD